MTKELTQTQINMIAVYLAHGILVKSGGAAAPGFQVVLALAVQEHVISRFGPLTEMKQLSMLQEKCSIAAKVSSDIGHVLMNPWGIVSGPHKLSIVEFFTLVELVDEGYLSCGNFARSEWRDAAVKFFNECVETPIPQKSSDLPQMARIAQTLQEVDLLDISDDPAARAWLGAAMKVAFSAIAECCPEGDMWVPDDYYEPFSLRYKLLGCDVQGWPLDSRNDHVDGAFHLRVEEQDGQQVLAVHARTSIGTEIKNLFVIRPGILWSEKGISSMGEILDKEYEEIRRDGLNAAPHLIFQTPST